MRRSHSNGSSEFRNSALIIFDFASQPLCIWFGDMPNDWTELMDELDIWRAANQLLIRYGLGAEMEAAQRADMAYAAGDLFNFNLWTRITVAVQGGDPALLNL